MIAIVDNGGANLGSIIFALQRLGYAAELTQDIEKIKNASHVILPGVGAAQFAMQRLHRLCLIETIRNLTQPVLGICLGMQILYDFSAEGKVACLGITSGMVNQLNPQPVLAVPHMGWNQLLITKPSLLFAGLPAVNYCYFVHSYAAPVTAATCATAEYNQTFTAVIEQYNFFGTQFHPEKSGETGATILRNFLRL